MNSKQQAAQTAINQLAIDLIARLNQEQLTEKDVCQIREIANKIQYEINDLNDWEAFERLFDPTGLHHTSK